MLKCLFLESSRNCSFNRTNSNKANGAEDNEAERNALDKAGKTAAQEIINTLRSAGIN